MLDTPVGGELYVEVKSVTLAESLSSSSSDPRPQSLTSKQLQWMLYDALLLLSCVLSLVHSLIVEYQSRSCSNAIFTH